MGVDVTLSGPQWSALLVSMLLLFAGAACARRFALRRGDVFRRGTWVRDGRPGRIPGFHRTSRAGTLTLGRVAVAPLDETKHFKLIGTTGTGKSTAIRELMAAALARGDRAVFADPDGGYRDSFARRLRADVILNPFETDSVMWDPLAEIVERSDVEHLAHGLIPSSADASANEWRIYARTFLSAVLLRGRFDRPCNCAELWRLLAVAPAAELRDLVADTPAQPFLDEENARMFGSIRSVAVSALSALPYIVMRRGNPFSVREWVRHGRGNVIFLPYRARQIAALRSLIATWMRIAIFEAMDQGDGFDQRLWFVVDELDALGAIEGLKDALARLRKFGGRCVLGFQSIGQVSGTYGTAEAQTLVENCGNTLILRCAGSENGGTSQFASRLIGEREVARRQVTRGRDSSSFSFAGARRSSSVSLQHVTEPAVLASEIERLPDLKGYLKLASSPAWLKVSLPRSGA